MDKIFRVFMSGWCIKDIIIEDWEEKQKEIDEWCKEEGKPLGDKDLTNQIIYEHIHDYIYKEFVDDNLVVDEIEEVNKV